MKLLLNQYPYSGKKILEFTDARSLNIDKVMNCQNKGVSKTIY